ncbi:MAG: hypothetical protein CMF62_02915 [Magnetococcales bacterium]|nr:hypothetical protein [Magnetococcales bacterium]|tara:strand:- start:3881 stop:4735 length:855 start_codon:yes stop_codon:yes gene_type:complete
MTDVINRVIRALNIIRPDNKVFIIKTTAGNYLLFNHCIETINSDKLKIPCWSYAQILNSEPESKDLIYNRVKKIEVNGIPYYILIGLQQESQGNSLLFMRKDSDGQLFENLDALDVKDSSPDLRALRENYGEYQKILRETPTNRVMLTNDDINLIMESASRYAQNIDNNLRLMYNVGQNTSQPKTLYGGAINSDTSEPVTLDYDNFSDINDDLKFGSIEDLNALDDSYEDINNQPDLELKESLRNEIVDLGIFSKMKKRNYCNEEPMSEYTDGLLGTITIEDIQ